MSGASGPATTRSTAFSRAKAHQPGDILGGDRHALGEVGDAGIARRRPELPQQRRLGEGPGEGVLAPAAADQQDLHALLRRCSGARARRNRSPPAAPYHMVSRMDMPSVPRRPGADNLPDYAVSEIAGAIKRTLKDAFGRVRVRGEITELKRYPSGHVYLSLKDEGAKLEAVVWKTNVRAPRHPAGERAGGARHRAHRHLRRPFQVPARHRPAGLRRRGRAARPDRAAAAAPARGGALRRRAQAADPAAAARHRRGHQRARRGHPGHPHHRRPALPAAHPPLARRRAGPRRGGADRGRHRGLRRPAAGRAGAAPGRADRGARRRQPRRPDGLQRGGGGARRRHVARSRSSARSGTRRTPR